MACYVVVLYMHELLVSLVFVHAVWNGFVYVKLHVPCFSDDLFVFSKLCIICNTSS